MVTVIAMLLMNAGYNDIKALGLLLASSGVYCILMKPIMLRKWDARKKTAALIIAAAMIEALLVWLLLVI